jgi:hypothetical protein
VFFYDSAMAWLGSDAPEGQADAELPSAKAVVGSWPGAGSVIIIVDRFGNSINHGSPDFAVEATSVPRCGLGYYHHGALC